MVTLTGNEVITSCCDPRKELKDPDQLYSTLKTILQHVKVRGTHTCTQLAYMHAPTCARIHTQVSHYVL